MNCEGREKWIYIQIYDKTRHPHTILSPPFYNLSDPPSIPLEANQVQLNADNMSAGTPLISNLRIFVFWVDNKFSFRLVKEKQSSQSVISANDATTAKLVQDETQKIKHLEQKMRQLEMKVGRSKF